MENFYTKISKLNLNDFSLILISLIPLSLVSGPLIPEIIILFINISFLFLIFKIKNFDFLNTRILKLFLLFYVYIILRSLFSENILFSLKSSLFYFRFGLFVFAFNFFFHRSNNEIKKYFYNILLISLIFVGTDAIFQYFIGYNFFLMKENVLSRISGLFGDEMILGSYIARFFPMIIAIAYFSKNQLIKNKRYPILLFFFFAFVIFISGERTSLILLAVISIIYFLAINKQIYYFIFIFLIFFAVIVLDKNLNKRYLQYTVENFITTQTDKTSESTSLINNNESKIIIFNEHYTAHYRSALRMFKDNILFGHGPRMFRYLCGDEKYFVNANYNFRGDDDKKFTEKIPTGSCSTHPHNIYMQFLSELGIIGFIFLIFVQTLVIREIYLSSKKNDKYNCLLLTSILVCIWPLSPSGNFFNNWLSMVLFFLISMYFLKRNFFLKD